MSAIKSSRVQLNIQLFMKYTERYEHILEGFPAEAIGARFDSCALPPESDELRLCVLKYLNLCSEEFYLHKKGYLPTDLWDIWEADLKTIIASPLVRRDWVRLRSEFSSHKGFQEFVEKIQSE